MVFIPPVTRAKYPATEVEMTDGSTVQTAVAGVQADDTGDDAAIAAAQADATTALADAATAQAAVDAVEINELTRTRKPGLIASAILNFAGLPLDTETITIDGEVWTSIAGVPAGAAKEFQIGTVEGSIDNFVTRFNLHTAKNLVADKLSATEFRIRTAAAPGGAAAAANPSMVLSDTETNASWNVNNINETGQTAGIGLVSFKRIPITALNILLNIEIVCPFTPVSFQMEARDAAGTRLTAHTATALISGTKVVIDPDAGATPLVATDIIDLVIFGNES